MKENTMTAFVQQSMAPPSAETIRRMQLEASARGLDFEKDVAPRLFQHPGELFTNNRYHVIRERIGTLWHLSIRPLSVMRNRSWQEFQQIKNELVGPECEGVELFPAESRLMNIAEQYHIWVAADPTFRFPFGFD